MVDLLTYPRPGYTSNWQDFIPQVTKSPLGNVIPLWNCYDDDDAPNYYVHGGEAIDFWWNSKPQNLTGCDRLQVRLWTDLYLDLIYIQLQSWDGSTYTDTPFDWSRSEEMGGEPVPAFAEYVPDWWPYVMLLPINPIANLDPSGPFTSITANPGWTTLEFSLKQGYVWPSYDLVDIPPSVIENCWWVWFDLWAPHSYNWFNFKIPYIVGARVDAQVF